MIRRGQPSKLLTPTLPSLFVTFCLCLVGRLHPSFDDGGSPSAAGAGFDGFQADGQITFRRFPVRAITVTLSPAPYVFVGRGDSTFNRPCRFPQFGFYFHEEDRMPIEVLTLNQFFGGDMGEKILARLRIRNSTLQAVSPLSPIP
jgi:hypothetical protein